MSAWSISDVEYKDLQADVKLKGWDLSLTRRTAQAQTPAE
jgi:hypothetical protein